MTYRNVNVEIILGDRLYIIKKIVMLVLRSEPNPRLNLKFIWKKKNFSIMIFNDTEQKK